MVTAENPRRDGTVAREGSKIRAAPPAMVGTRKIWTTKWSGLPPDKAATHNLELAFKATTAAACSSRCQIYECTAVATPEVGTISGSRRDYVALLLALARPSWVPVKLSGDSFLSCSSADGIEVLGRLQNEPQAA